MLLVITSTVYVNSNLTMLTDPVERMNQYQRSINFYLRSRFINSIIICDNSNFDFNPLIDKQLASGKEIEVLSFNADTSEILKRGKGYGEGAIMEYIFENSMLIKNDEKGFCKITGRLEIDNIDDILASLEPDCCYFQGLGLNPFINTGKLDTRFYYCNKDVFKKYLLNAYNNVLDDKGVYLEHAYYNTLKTSPITPRAFVTLPFFKGISGSTAQPYTISRKRWMILNAIYKVLTFFNILWR